MSHRAGQAVSAAGGAGEGGFEMRCAAACWQRFAEVQHGAVESGEG